MALFLGVVGALALGGVWMAMAVSGASGRNARELLTQAAGQMYPRCEGRQRGRPGSLAIGMQWRLAAVFESPAGTARLAVAWMRAVRARDVGIMERAAAGVRATVPEAVRLGLVGIHHCWYGTREKGLELLRAAVELEDWAELRELLLGQLRADWERDEVLSVAEEVLVREPGNLLALGQKSQALAEAGRGEEAEALAREAVGLREDGWTWSVLGYALLKRERYDAAAEMFEKVADGWAERRVEALTHVAKCRLGQGRLEEARGLLAEVLELEAGNEEALGVLAKLERGGG